MIPALHRVSLRHFASHKLRTVFTVAGVALGVAAMVSIRLLHESVSHSYARAVERMAGKAVLQVTNGELGVPEELAEELRAVEGVGAAAASVQGFLPVVGLEGEKLYLLGVDLLADDQLRDYDTGAGDEVVEDPLAFLAQADSVALTSAFLAGHELKTGDRIRVRAPAGATELAIRATLDVATGPATLFGGRLAVMDVFAAQRLFRLDRRFTQIDLGLAGGAQLATVERAVRERVGGRALVERPERRGRALDELIAANNYTFTVASMLAVLVGLYLIFNTMMIAVVQRRREIGVLRALGMRRGELVRLIASESLLLGAIGAAAGIPLGLALARAGSVPFATSLSDRFLPVEPGAVALEPWPVFWGVVLGLASAVVAAVAPAREAVRVHPLEALRPAVSVSAQTHLYRRSAIAGGVVVSLAIALWALRGGLPFSPNVSGSFATLGLLVGVSLAAPAAVRLFALRAEQPIARVLGPIGALASRAIVSHVRRVAITCAAFLVSLAGAIGIATLIASSQWTLGLWIDQVFADVDLMVNSSRGKISFTESLPFPESLVGEIAALDGVARAHGARFSRVPFEGSHVFLAAPDRTSDARPPNLALVEGDWESARAMLEREPGVLVNEPFARRFGRWRGDSISFASPNGEVRLRIAGVYFDFQDMGEVSIERDLYRRLWRDDTVSFVNVALEPGADRQRVADAIRRRWGKEYGLFVLTSEELRGEFEAMLGQVVAGAYQLIVISIVIALLGIVNSLVASVLDRTREIGVLRAIGATRGQVARAFVVEAAIIGLLSAALASLVGSVLGYYQLEIIARGMLAMTIFYRYPAGAVAFGFVTAIVLAAVAGYLPGRRASRLRITEALEYE